MLFKKVKQLNNERRQFSGLTKHNIKKSTLTNILSYSARYQLKLTATLYHPVSNMRQVLRQAKMPASKMFPFFFKAGQPL